MARYRDLTKIDFILGMPPITTATGDPIHTERTADILRNAMPTATIYPGIPSFESGIDLFRRIPVFDIKGHHPDYKKVNSTYYLPMLEEHGYTLDKEIHNDGLKLAYLADNFPTDTFTNEYGENFLQKFTDVASEGAASLAQMFGARNVTDLASGMTTAAQKQGGVVGTVGDMARKAGDYINKLGGMFSDFSPAGARMGKMIGSLAAGSRIDFPMVWKSSSFQPSYTMTVRLYNPDPTDTNTTKKYIIGPIAAIMLLGIPISEDGSTYSWPFLHRVDSPGIYQLDPAFIQNITIIKGGDQQQIAYNQRLGMVDVRIDFGSLFSSMLAANKRTLKTRPTLRKYLRSMEDRTNAWTTTGGSLKNRKTISKEKVLSASASVSRPGTTIVKGPGRNQQAFTQSTSILDAATPEKPKSRVSQTIKDIGKTISDQIQKDFKIDT